MDLFGIEPLVGTRWPIIYSEVYYVNMLPFAMHDAKMKVVRMHELEVFL